MTIHELVHVKVQWVDGKGYPNGSTHGLWFKVLDGRVELAAHYDGTDALFGYMTFTPLNTSPDFLITPFVSNLDMELNDKGVEETFAIGDDIETLARLALEARTGPDSTWLVNEHYWSAIAVYEVSVTVSHGEWENESEMWYELLGILDNAKLPLALVGHEPPPSPETKWFNFLYSDAPTPTNPLPFDDLPNPPNMVSSYFKVCKCDHFEGNGVHCAKCGGFIF